MIEKPDTYNFGPFVLDAQNLELTCGERSVDLTATESKILYVLVLACVEEQMEVSYAVLKQRVWRTDNIEDNALGQHVKSLREKLHLKGLPPPKGQSIRSYTSQLRKAGKGKYDLEEFIKNMSGAFCLTVPVEPGHRSSETQVGEFPHYNESSGQGVNRDTPPYPGSRSFLPNDDALFFGREREREELVSALAKDRVLLFYSPSGAGKTSLINVALRSGKIARESRILYVPHVGLPSEIDRVPDLQNPFTFSAIAGLRDDPSIDSLPLTWTAYLRELLSKDVTPVVLIIDQMEEIITTTPSAGYEKAQRDFFLELSNALWDHESLRVVLSFREEFYVQILRMASDITDQRPYPQWTAVALPLGKLTPESARAAIVGPAHQQGVNFEAGVLDALINELAPDQYEDIFKRKHGEVEPLQLQVVCRALWGVLSDRRKIISWGDIESALSAVTRKKSKQIRGREAVAAFVKSAIENFCGYAIEQVASDTKFPAELIDLGCQQFVSKSGFRRFVHQEREYTGELPNEVITALERQQILHSEQRGTERLCGLAHDKLIEPIRERAALALRLRGRTAFPKFVASIIVCVSAATTAVLGTMIIRGFFAIPRLTLTQAPDVSWAAGWFHGVIGALVWAVFIAAGMSYYWFFWGVDNARRIPWFGSRFFGAISGLIGGAFITIALLWAQRPDSLWAALWTSTRDSRWTAFTVTGIGYSMLFLGTGVGLGSAAAVSRILLGAKWEALVRETPKRMSGPETRRVLIAISRLVMVRGAWPILLSMMIVTSLFGLIVRYFQVHFAQPQLKGTADLGLLSAPLWARLVGECLSITSGGVALAIGLLFGMYLLRKGIDLPDEEIFSLRPKDGTREVD